MLRLIGRTFFKITGWTNTGEVPRHGILIGAPHTSNWDFLYMLMVMWAGGVPPRPLMKKEVFVPVVGWVLRRFGAIPVDRKNPGELLENIVAEANAADGPFIIVMAAEGTRRGGDYWKSGFYRIALRTGLPLALAYLDKPTRSMGFGPTMEVTGDVRADMQKIRDFYADKNGLIPANRIEPRLREEEAENPSFD